LIPLPIEFGVSDYTKTFASLYIYICCRVLRFFPERNHRVSNLRGYT